MPQKQELVTFTNGQFFTLDDSNQIKTFNNLTVNLADGTIFSRNPLKSNPKIKIIDLKNKIILPGLHDSHLHIQYTGNQSSICDFKNCQGLEEFKTRIENYVIKTKPNLLDGEEPFFLGGNFEQDVLGFMPSAKILDKILEELSNKHQNPKILKINIIIPRICFHIMVANSKTKVLYIRPPIFEMSRGRAECPLFSKMYLFSVGLSSYFVEILITWFPTTI